MGQSLACLAVLAAVLGAAMHWDLPTRPAAPALQAKIDAANQKGITPLTTAKVKPRVPRKIVVKRRVADGDNSNSSTAALGLRPCRTTPGFSSSCRRAGWRLQATGRGMLALKDQAWKSILGRTS